jgi:pyruvate dehydrogenase E2 component (dihydrolipoamide acetyltransferase)
MATEIIMPKAGMAMERGTIIQWFKKPGEAVEAGEPLLEIETDKVAMEVEAEVSGYLLKTLFGEGDEVDVITTIGYIGEKDEVPPAQANEPSAASVGPAPETSRPTLEPELESSSAPAPDSGPDSSRSGVRATPAARFLARQEGVSLPSVTPTGKWNEIRRRDVEATLQDGGSSGHRAATTAAGTESGTDHISPVARTLAERHGVDTTTLTGTGPAGRIVKQDVLDAAERKGASPSVSGTGGSTTAGTRHEDVERPLTGMRRTIAQRMVESHQTVPPVTMNKKIDVTALFALRDQVNRDLEESISLTPYFVRAVACALAEAPYMRTLLGDKKLVERGNIDIGIAVALDDGLMVPVLRNADTLSVGEIALRTKDLAHRARNRGLSPDELTGGVFSITNLGMYGISSFTPIINPPETAILGINAAEDELYLRKDGAVASRKVLTLSLTIDHRVIDGAQGALFLKLLEGYLTKPMRLLV